jgi:hypothetical protein
MHTYGNPGISVHAFQRPDRAILSNQFTFFLNVLKKRHGLVAATVPDIPGSDNGGYDLAGFPFYFIKCVPDCICTAVIDRTIWFAETPSGQLDFVSGQNMDTPASQTFVFDEIGRTASLRVYGQPGLSPTRPHHYRFLVKAAKILSYYHAGVVFRVETWINYDFMKDIGYLSLLQHMLGKKAVDEIFFEFTLGVFGDRNILHLNTSWLIGGVPKDLNQAARDWYENTAAFSTRVVGFGFRKERFSLPSPATDSLCIKAGDTVFLVREFHNSHDPNAVAILWQNGEKMGYLRRHIAQYLAPVLDQGRLYCGQIAAVLGG